MNGALIVIGLLLFLAGAFVAADAQAFLANPGWFSFLGDTVAAIQQTAVYLAIAGVFILVIGACV
jgi:hypothetical protein